PLKVFTGKIGITNMRGKKVMPSSRMRLPNDCTVIATFHPSYLNYQQGEKKTMAYNDMLNDFKFAKRLMKPEEKKELPTHNSIKLYPNFTEESLIHALDQLEECQNVGIDLEWTAIPGR